MIKDPEKLEVVSLRLPQWMIEEIKKRADKEGAKYLTYLRQQLFKIFKTARPGPK